MNISTIDDLLLPLNGSTIISTLFGEVKGVYLLRDNERGKYLSHQSGEEVDNITDVKDTYMHVRINGLTDFDNALKLYTFNLRAVMVIKDTTNWVDLAHGVFSVMSTLKDVFPATLSVNLKDIAQTEAGLDTWQSDSLMLAAIDYTQRVGDPYGCFMKDFIAKKC